MPSFHVVSEVGEANPKSEDSRLHNWILEVTDAVSHGEGEEATKIDCRPSERIPDNIEEVQPGTW